MNTFTRATKHGFFSRIMSSIFGIFIGAILFIISFVVLYMNEGRVNVANIAQDAISIESTTTASQQLDGQLVSIEGVLQSKESIGDAYLQKGPYIALYRKVEMYSWNEEKKSKTKKNVGGSTTTDTTYSYSQGWTSKPEDSSAFANKDGHKNPSMIIDNSSSSVNKAQIGIYEIDVKSINLPLSQQLPLNSDNVILESGMLLVGDMYIYRGKGTMDNPQVGDVRISYNAVNNPTNNITAFGKLDLSKSMISSYTGKKSTKLYRIFAGTKEEAISMLDTEYNMQLWIFRILGFVMMFFGLLLILNPICVLLDILPMLGSLGRLGIGIISFFVSIVLSGITIVVSMILHNIFVLVLVLTICCVGMYMYMKKKSLR